MNFVSYLTQRHCKKEDLKIMKQDFKRGKQILKFFTFNGKTGIVDSWMGNLMLNPQLERSSLKLSICIKVLIGDLKFRGKCVTLENTFI